MVKYKRSFTKIMLMVKHWRLLVNCWLFRGGCFFYHSSLIERKTPSHSPLSVRVWCWTVTFECPYPTHAIIRGKRPICAFSITRLVDPSLTIGCQMSNYHNFYGILTKWFFLLRRNIFMMQYFCMPIISEDIFSVHIKKTLKFGH